MPCCRRAILSLFVLALVAGWPSRAAASSILYSNMTLDGQFAVVSHPGGPSPEVEAADDFILTSDASITEVSFLGLVSDFRLTQLSQLGIEFYRVFPLDSNTTRTPDVPTRTNSPSDVAFAEHSFSAGDVVSASIVSPSFAASNSVQDGGIHAPPFQTTNGNGPVAGVETRFDLTLASPIFLPAGHYFFVPQVPMLASATFDWLSALRPIQSPGTPIVPDLQAWVRDENLDPDWLRIGTDIVGGATPPTFNMAFEIQGNAATRPVPEPVSLVLLGSGVAVLARRRRLIRGA